jgi:phosphoglycolate phosphatase-like HAD superfamily hydrolase
MPSMLWRARAGALARSLQIMVCLALPLAGTAPAWAESDPLPSWNDTATKTAIESFVTQVTATGTADFVPADDRIAVFDNDGTLMVEMPSNINLSFAVDEIRALSADHPEWRTDQPFKAVLDGDQAFLSHLSPADTLKLFLAAFAGTDQATFEQTASIWLKHAKNSKFNLPYKRLIYQPQLELIQFLRANGFKIYLVSGGEIDFLRRFAPAAYGIPPDQVIGSSVRYGVQVVEGQPTVERLPVLGSFSDGTGKVANIQLHIGKQPILAFGNADGDEPMLAMTAAGKSPHLVLVLHHDDPQREFAYDREASNWARLDKLWDEASERHWQIVSMKDDFKLMFPPGPHS